jgi:hypothetical protein
MRSGRTSFCSLRTVTLRRRAASARPLLPLVKEGCRKPYRGRDVVCDFASGDGDYLGRHGNAATVRECACCCSKGSIAIAAFDVCQGCNTLSLASCVDRRGEIWRGKPFRDRGSLRRAWGPNTVGRAPQEGEGDPLGAPNVTASAPKTASLRNNALDDA